MKFQFDKLEPYRVRQNFRGTNRWASSPGDDFGAFMLPGPCGRELKVIASSGVDEVPWEHVSVSLSNRCPNWLEMCFVCDLFWDETETVMQLHPPRSQWINNHPYCLHLWRPLNESIPLPPQIAVGFKELNPAGSEENQKRKEDNRKC